MTNSEGPKKNNGNSLRNRIIVGVITVLGLLVLLTLLANPGLFVPPNGDAEAQNQPPTTSDNENNIEDNSTNPDKEYVGDNLTNEIPIIPDNNTSNVGEPKVVDSNGSNEGSAGTVTKDDNSNRNDMNDRPNVPDEDENTVVVSGSVHNHRPVASSGSVTTDLDTSVLIHLNASDSDADSLTFIILTNPMQGSLTELSNGNEVTYTPNPNYQGTDNFTFRVSDSKLNSVAANIKITVVDYEGNGGSGEGSPNHAPQVNDIEVESGQNTALLINLHGNTIDIDNDPLSFSVIDLPTKGTVEINENGTITYLPDQDFVGTDSFTYQANDGTANSNIGQVSITIKETYVLQMEDNTFSYGVELNSGKPSTVEYVGPQSTLIGKDINTMILWLSKAGNPEGQIEIGVFNDDLSVKKLFGTVEATDITEDAANPGQYRFSLPESDLPYTIEEGDRLGIKFTGGDLANFIAVQVDDDVTDPFDGSNTYKSFYETDWVDIQNADLSMSLILSS